MITPNQLKGTGVALVTPFNSKLEIDFDALENLLHYIMRNQVEFIVVLGTTSEASTLSDKEKLEVVRKVVDVNTGKLPIIMGLGGNNTSAVIDHINKTNFDGIDGILSVAPFYNKPNQEGLYQHFRAISTASPVPVILYNVPGRTASNIEASTTLRLAHDCEQIIGIKEASGNFGQIMEVIQNKPNGFSLLSGDDATTLPILALGGEGVISVSANAFPFEFSQMVRETINGSIDQARELHYSLINLISLIFEEGNPAGIKAILELKGLIENQLRLPLTPVSNILYEAIKAQLDIK